MRYPAFVRHLTIRNVPHDLADRLDEERRLRGRSLNQTVLDLLAQALRLDGGRRSNGLAALAGTWSQDDAAALESTLRFTEAVDEELWR